MSYIRLPLEGAPNVRELGGYPTLDGKVTKHKVFIRGSRLTDLTSKDNNFLKDYGVTDIIDLRGKPELQTTFISDDNLTEGYFNFHYVPLANIEGNAEMDKNENIPNADLGYCYFLMCKNKEKVKEFFDVLVNAKGAVLYHCTAGKDRTGIVSALILGLCNVDYRDIVSNYEVTNTYVNDEPFMAHYTDEVKQSRTWTMKTFIKLLLEEYGSFENYLLSCDISKEDLDIIKNKFLMEE